MAAAVNASQMYDFLLFVTALYFRVAFIQVSPRIYFSYLSNEGSGSTISMLKHVVFIQIYNVNVAHMDL